jgi:DNA-directed RNA polymerase specialized sigma24 family protein
VSERETAQQRRHAREFEAFVAGAAGRLLHAATLLTAEPADANPRAQQLLAAALSTTYARWQGLRGEDPYDCTRQDLAARFARSAWHHRAWRDWVWHHRAWQHRTPRPGHRPGHRRGGLLEVLTPQERLIVVLRLYEGVPEEQTAAQLGLPEQRVRALCARAVTQVYETHEAYERARVRARQQQPDRARERKQPRAPEAEPEPEPESRVVAAP